uniref:Retrotransposon gag domain-containing protein n=1 Tax=Tanacetum cinerariifolium TaxID=118510 RepID=A0A6L2NIW0_TANCI|nr:hypothetical protein [Tanacetum cinerariifolium]
MTRTKPSSYQFLDDNLDTSPIALRLLTTPTSSQQTPPQTIPQTTPQTNPQSTPSPQTTPTPPTTPPPPPPTSQHSMITRSKFKIMKDNPKYNFHVTTSSPIPKSLFHALRDPNWKQAMLFGYAPIYFWILCFLGDNLLAWSSKRQDTLSRFSVEAEYLTLDYCDNLNAVHMSANLVQHQRTKHIDIDIYFVRDKVAAGHVRVLHVPSRFQYADIFTKGSITTWEDLTTHFLAQFFPPVRTAKLCNDILMFQQHQGESLSEAWTHFKDLLQKVSHHGIDLWL